MQAARDDQPRTDGARVLVFCGHCHHFEVSTFGDGGSCHKAHDTVEKARAGACPDKHEVGHTGGGPRFDMSE